MVEIDASHFKGLKKKGNQDCDHPKDQRTNYTIADHSDSTVTRKIEACTKCGLNLS